MCYHPLRGIFGSFWIIFILCSKVLKKDIYGTIFKKQTGRADSSVNANIIDVNILLKDLFSFWIFGIVCTNIFGILFQLPQIHEQVVPLTF